MARTIERMSSVVISPPGRRDSRRQSSHRGDAASADDMAELVTSLGHDQFHLHGEVRGAEFAYVLAATRPGRVKTLCFAEMLQSGEGLEEVSFFTGHEREFWEFWIKAETDNPTAITNEAIDEWISKVKAPGGLRGVLETYRAGLENGRINQELKRPRSACRSSPSAHRSSSASWSRSRCSRWPRRSTVQRS